MTVNDTSQNYLRFIFVACLEKKNNNNKTKTKRQQKRTTIHSESYLKYAPAHKLHCNSQSEAWQPPLSRASRANGKPLVTLIEILDDWVKKLQII